VARTLVAISILLAAAASAAAQPPAAQATAPEATTRANTPAPIEAALPATTHFAEPVAAPAAAAAATPPAKPAEARPTAPAPTVAADVPKIEMKKLTDDTVCRTERPTGSQIGIRRCYSRSAAQTPNDEIMRRDIEEMRARQNEQQAREAAAAMTRRRTGL